MDFTSFVHVQSCNLQAKDYGGNDEVLKHDLEKARKLNTKSRAFRFLTARRGNPF